MLTAVPVLALAAFVLIVLGATIAGGGEPDDHLPAGEPLLAALLFVFVAGSLLLRPVYLQDARANAGLADAERARWLFVLRMYFGPAMAVYWWRQVRRRPST